MTDAELAAARLTALLDAEREITALRCEVAHLRGVRAGMDERLRTMVPNDKATAAERAAVVAYLQYLRSLQPDRMTVVAVSLHILSGSIERGEHRRKETK